MIKPKAVQKFITWLLVDLATVTVCAALLTFSGCRNPKDITKDSSYGNFSAVVGPWKTKRQLWLMEIEGKPYLAITNAHYNETYREIAALPSGTEIRIDRLTDDSTIEVSMLRAWGSLVSGPNSGKIFELDPDLFAPNCQKSLRSGQPLKQGETWSVADDKLQR